MNFLRVSFKVLLILALTLLGFVIVANIWIYSSTNSSLYSDLSEVPDSNIALVLGTSHRLSDGSPNPYFHERVKAAAYLYHQGKVRHILVSGDNATKYYNEPKKMYDALLALDVPKKDITLDFAGFRTLDSIIRCKEIFDQDNITIITQPFHSYRALFICDHHDIRAVGLAITDIPNNFSMKVKFREVLARPLAIIDLYILNTQPKYLGEKEPITL